MTYYISQFDIGADFDQPHNFVLINGEPPVSYFPLEYHQQPNYKIQYQWINSSELGFIESFFDSVLTERQFQNVSASTVIINSSSAKLRMEFIKNELPSDTGDADRQQQLKTALLILDPFSDKPVQFFNLTDGSGELSFKLARPRKFPFVI